MAKEIRANVKMQLPAGAATPAPPVGSMLGKHQVSLMEFCKQFNAKTAHLKGNVVPVVVTIYTDKSFSFVIKTPPVSHLIRKKANIAKGSSKPKTDKVGRITKADVEMIAKEKLPDLNTTDLEQAKKIVAGSARSMGVDIID